MKSLERQERLRERIIALLEAAFAPERLDVVDESHLHAGHAGWRPGGGTHMRVEIKAAAFVGLSRLARQRRVNAVLADCFADGLHALSVRARAAGEDETL